MKENKREISINVKLTKYENIFFREVARKERVSLSELLRACVFERYRQKENKNERDIKKDTCQTFGNGVLQ